MNLYGILSWYDESPTWLSATVASLSRIGVSHVIAIDGAYQHFDGAACSGLEQSDAVMRAADSVGMGCTIVRPNEKRWTEQQKRQACFDYLSLIAEHHVDWCTIIDGDEVIVDGTPSFCRTLAELPDDTHCAAGQILQRIDPHTTIGVHNTDKTPEIFRNIPVSPEYPRTRQSRFWRVMDDMRVVHTHYSFTGVDRNGVTINIRPDMNNSVLPGLPHTPIAVPDDMPTFEHRDEWRTAFRRGQKKAYYTLRDDLGIERV